MILGLLHCMAVDDVANVFEVCVASIFREYGKVCVGYRFENNGWEEVGADVPSKLVGRKGWESCAASRFNDNGVNTKVKEDEMR
jgi:hypothetical protein